MKFKTWNVAGLVFLALGLGATFFNSEITMFFCVYVAIYCAIMSFQSTSEIRGI